jgi:hypothetical protein
LTFGLALRATLGIPGSSVGSEAICVGSDRLARTFAARRQRLAIGAKPRLLRCTLALRACLQIGTCRTTRIWTTGTARATTATTTAAARTATAMLATAATGDVRTFRTEVVLAGTEARHEAALAGAAMLTEVVARTTRAASTGTTRTTGTTPTSTWTTTTAGTTRAATTRTTGTTSATRTTTTAASTAITEVARRSSQLPTDTGARHLAATRTIVFLLLFLRRADLEAAEATRLVAIATTTEAAATAARTAATATLAATITTFAASTASTATIVVATTLRRTGNAIDHVVELAARNRAVRSLLALEHAHEADLIDAVADDVERFEQALGAIGLHTECGCDGVDRRIFCGGLRLGCFAAFTRGFRCSGLAIGRSGLTFGRSGLTFGRRGLTLGRRGLRACISGLGSRRVGKGDVARARRFDSRLGRGPAPTGRRTRSGRVTEQQRGEFGERLHRTG